MWSETNAMRQLRSWKKLMICTDCFEMVWAQAAQAAARNLPRRIWSHLFDGVRPGRLGPGGSQHQVLWCHDMPGLGSPDLPGSQGQVTSSLSGSKGMWRLASTHPVNSDTMTMDTWALGGHLSPNDIDLVWRVGPMSGHWSFHVPKSDGRFWLFYTGLCSSSLSHIYSGAMSHRPFPKTSFPYLTSSIISI